MLTKMLLSLGFLSVLAAVSGHARQAPVVKPRFEIGAATVRCWQGSSEVSYEVRRYDLPGTWAKSGSRVPVQAWRLRLLSDERLITTAQCSVIELQD